MNNSEYLERQRGYESNARTYPRRIPIAIVKAQGLYVTDADGRQFIDCLSGAGVLTLGHNHPVVIEALQQHLASGLPMQTLDITTPVKDEFASALLSTLPADFARRARIQFCSPSGSDAVEAALKLVKTATGREPIWAVRGAFHGQTHGALALMGNLGPKSAVHGLMPGVQFMPFPYRYRCPMHSGVCESCHCSDYVRDLLADAESGAILPAAFITEAVQGEGGAIPADDGWLRNIRELTSKHGIPLIIDEVQTGWGRTGRMYAFEHSGIIPDVLVLSKAIGGGLPLSVIIYDERLDVWKPGAHSGTFRGNQMAMSAGIATLQFIRENDLCANSAKMGQLFLEQLSPLRRHAIFGDLRVKGLMIGIEVVHATERDDAGRQPGDGAMAARIQAECFKRGLILELGGRNGAVIRLLPPLTITAQQVRDICHILADAFSAVS